MYLEGLTFHYVTDIKEVLALALTNEKVNGAIDFNITNQKTEENETKDQERQVGSLQISMEKTYYCRKKGRLKQINS